MAFCVIAKCGTSSLLSGQSLSSLWLDSIKNIKLNLFPVTLVLSELSLTVCPSRGHQPIKELQTSIDCFLSQLQRRSSSTDCLRSSTQQAYLSGALRRDADAEQRPWSVASSHLNVCPHAVSSEVGALCWPLCRGFAVVSSGAAAGGSSRRRCGHGHSELEAVHLRRDGLDCRRIR